MQTGNPDEPRIVRRLAAILAADVVGYSRLMERDEAGTLERLKQHRRELIDPLIAEHRGRVVKLMGDGTLCEFASVVDAVACAVAIQRGMAHREPNVPELERIRLRIGVNLGEVIVEGEDIYGDGVNVASRLEALADPGGICVSGKVREELRKRLDLVFAPMGAQRVKNLSQPVETWRVVLDEDGRARVREKAARRAPGLRGMAAGAVLLVLAAAGVVGWRGLSGREGPQASGEASVAMLPLVNLSGDERLGRLADGMVADIITDLSGSRLLTVIAPGTSFGYRDEDRDPRRIGRELGVNYVVEGSLQGDGQRLRANVRLIEASTGVQLWSERYDRPVEDLFAIQDELTNRIANALREGTLAAALEAARGKSPEDLRAYDLLLLAKEQRWLWTKDANLKAVDLARQALTLSPRLVAAQVELSQLYRQQIDAGFADSVEDALASWRDGAIAAVGLDQTYARAHAVLGVYYVYAKKPDLAMPELERALDLAPGNAEVLGMVAEQLPYLGHPARAVELVEQAVRLDPNSFYNDVKWQAYFFARRFKEAAEAVESTPEPQRWPQLYATMSYAQLGNEKSLQLWRTGFLETWPNYSYELGASEGVGYAPTAEAEHRLWVESHVKADLPICATPDQLTQLAVEPLPECDAERAKNNRS